MILWLRVRVTSTHSADVITILRVFVESRLVPPLSSNVSSNIRRRVWCRFLFKSERFRNLITVCWVLYFEKTESLAESLINFQLNFSNYMFLMYVSKMKIKLYCILKKKHISYVCYRHEIKVPSYDAMYRTRGDNPGNVWTMQRPLNLPCVWAQISTPYSAECGVTFYKTMDWQNRFSLQREMF